MIMEGFYPTEESKQKQRERVELKASGTVEVLPLAQRFVYRNTSSSDTARFRISIPL
jgi:hypothetical protein